MPRTFVGMLQTQGLTRQDLAGIDQTSLPLDLTALAHAPDGNTRWVFHLRQALRIGARRWAIDLFRRAMAQRLVGALVVVFRQKPVKRMLLGAQACRTGRVLCCFKVRCIRS